MQLLSRSVQAALILCTLFACLAAVVPSHGDGSGLVAQPVLQSPDKVCASCHQRIYDAYERTTMARGSGLAMDGLIEGGFEHQPSKVRYRIYADGGKVWMSYERTGTSAPIVGTWQLSYFIGSGHRGRTYLYQQDGLWFEVPINYYGKQKLWDMAPKHEDPRVMPAALPVEPNCLHCHASMIGTEAEGIRNRFNGPPFSQAGVGCSSCHGDPASHLEAENSHAGLGAIVNPAHLKPAQRDSVCLQCHLEGDAAIYKAGHSIATFRPGDNLQDYAVYFVDANRPAFGSRASSQYEALLRSACRRASGDRLTCTTCHDPHSTPDPANRVEFYRAKCLSCHATEAISVRHHPEQQDCAVCHMPTRNTADISHEQLTDHDIERRPKSNNTAPSLLDLGEHPANNQRNLVAVGSTPFSDRELGLAYAQFARKGDEASAEKAKQLLSKAEASGNADALVHEQLGFLEQIAGSKVAAARQYQQTLRLEPNNIASLADLAVLQASSGHVDDAVKMLRRVVELDPSQASADMNLAFIECSTGRGREARALLDHALIFNPDNSTLRNFIRTGSYAGGKCRLE